MHLKAVILDDKQKQQKLIVPECKEKKLLIRFGKSGEFLGCAGYPECPFTSNFKRDPETGVITLIEKNNLKTSI